MKKIISVSELKESILLLELKQAGDWILLKEQFHATYKSLKPINILKSTINEAISAPNLKSNVINAGIGITTGFVAKKIFMGGSHNPLRKLLGIALEMLVANKVAKNADGIKTIGSIILKKILTKNSE